MKRKDKGGQMVQPWDQTEPSELHEELPQNSKKNTIQLKTAVRF